MPAREALTTLIGLLVRNAPKAAPMMIRNSAGCQRARSFPPSIMKPTATQARTTTLPMIWITSCASLF